jgi:hypothetical protein
MDTNKRKRLLENLWYVDENLHLTDDPIKSVGFIDLVMGKYTYYFIINFFECIGTAKSFQEAKDLIKQWLKNKFSTHRLVRMESTFVPVFPLGTSVALCNENSAQHGREMEDCWVLSPFEGRIHIDDIYHIIDTVHPIKGIAKFEENDYGTIGCDKNFVHGVKGAFKVFPAVIVDYNAFPVHCQSVDLMDCKHYSNTHSLMCYNECVRREYFFKQRTSPVATVHVDLGSFNPLEDDYEPFAF